MPCLLFVFPFIEENFNPHGCSQHTHYCVNVFLCITFIIICLSMCGNLFLIIIIPYTRNLIFVELSFPLYVCLCLFISYFHHNMFVYLRIHIFKTLFGHREGTNILWNKVFPYVSVYVCLCLTFIIICLSIYGNIFCNLFWTNGKI